MNFFAGVRKRVGSMLSSGHHSPSVEIKEAGGSSGGQITNANLKNFVVKAAGQIDSSGSADFTSPETDLSEIRDAISVDSYIRLAVTKYSQLIFKAGYNIVGDNDAAAEYIQSRFNMMSFMTGVPMDVVFQQVAEDLVAYSNAFLIKSRVDMTNIGGLQAKGILDAKPVGGYFRVDPTTIQIKRDNTGTVKNYQQQVGNNKKTYKPTDVVHFYIDKKGGAAFGTPRIEAAMEDVKMLRKIEGNVLKLVYRYSAPLMQMKVGLPEAGFMATDQEIKDARTEIEKVSDDGIIITNERTDFKAIGAEGVALDAAKYLTYFENRVFAALSMSSAMVGRGGAKQDADSMEEQVHDSVKFFQRQIQVMIENGMINEMLLEGGYNPIMNTQDQVHFQFEEINLDTKVKMQTHAMNLFQGNVIPFEEARTQLGLRSDNVDESRLYANMIQQPNAMALAQAKTAQTGTIGTGSGSSSNSGQQAKQKTSGAAKSTMSPTNQHGTTSANIKESFDLTESSTSQNIDDYRKKFGAVYKKYTTVRNELCEDDTKAYIELPLIRDAISDSLKRYIVSNANDGFARAQRDAGTKVETDPTVISAVLINRVDKHLLEMFKDIQKKLKAASTKDERAAAFNSSEYRLRFLAEHVASKAYWYAYVKTACALDISQVYVDFNKGSKDSKEHNRVIHTSHFSLDDIPAFHPYCECSLELKKAGEK